jgi:hypothetical protein
VLTDTVKGLTVDFDGAVATGYGISPYTTPNGWDFSGDATEYVNQNSSDFEFQYGDSFSVEAVVLVNENYNSGYIVSNRQTDASGTQYSGWALIQKDGKIRAAIGGYPSNAYDWRNIDISTTDFNAHVYQKWSHIVWSNDGTTGGSKIYINGVDRTNSVADDATPPYTINYDSDFKLGFGADTASGTAPFTGNISACRIYNKNLSSEEVRRNYNAVANNYGLVPLPPPPPLDISGTMTDGFGVGAVDPSPTITLPSGGITGLSSIGIRGDSGYGVSFIFDNQTNRDAFVAAFPSNFAQLTWHDSYNNVDMITISGWVWDTSVLSNRLFVRSTQWSNWTGAGNSVGDMVDQTFTLQG